MDKIKSGKLMGKIMTGNERYANSIISGPVKTTEVTYSEVETNTGEIGICFDKCDFVVLHPETCPGESCCPTPDPDVKIVELIHYPSYYLPNAFVPEPCDGAKFTPVDLPDEPHIIEG